MTAAALPRALAAAGALLFAGALPASSQAQSNLLTDWSVPDMRQALVAAGATVTKETTLKDGAPYLAAQTKDGLKFGVYGTVCSGEPKRCKGANLTATYTYDSDAAVDEREKLIDRSAVGARNAGDNVLEVSRYLIFDEGVTRGNLRVNIEVFMDVATDIWNGEN
ncbi:MAG: hypothetical protein ACOY4K_07900 [Pseudomonadota bacterium]